MEKYTNKAAKNMVKVEECCVSSDLTYRDVMHLIAMTAEVAPLANNKRSWYKNGRGLWVSNDFGFGLLNAENMVLLAQGWVTVPPKHKCVISIFLE